MNLPKIIEASFLTSSASIKDAIDENTAEVVFMGRSNVGKSSLINSVTNIKNLAKSSSTPGKTRLINFFQIKYRYNQEDYFLRLVDLPGFGYAKVSKSMKKDWEKNLTEFISRRYAIKLFVQLIDSRHPGLELDNDVYQFLKEIKKPDQSILRVYTKADKLNQSQIAAVKKEEGERVVVSNLSKKGIDELNSKIFEKIFYVNN